MCENKARTAAISPAILLRKEEQLAEKKLLAEISAYKGTTAGHILGQSAKSIIEGLLPTGDKLVTLGLLLLHCSLHAGDNRFPFKKVGESYVMSQSSDLEFITAIDTASQLAAEAVNANASGAIAAMERLYPAWARQKYGCKLDEKFQSIMFNSPAIILDWDHHLPNRPLFGDIWHIPKDTTAPDFAYWKMSEFPPSFFLSDKPENDSKQYVEEVGKQLGIDPHEVLNRSVAHERVHRVITVPLNDFISPLSQNWWSEGIAITHGDIANYQNRPQDFYGSNRRLRVREIIDPNGEIDYLGSLSTWLSMAALNAGSLEPKDILTGSDGLIESLVTHAQSGKIYHPRDLPFQLFPNSNRTGLLNEMSVRRNRILNLLEASAFSGPTGN